MTTRRSEPSILPEDLPIRARRGEVSREQRAAFERVLEGDPALGVAYHVGRDFDVACRVQSGDDELILRASSRTLELPRSRANARRALTILAAALLLVASGAAASVWIAVGRDAPSEKTAQDRKLAPTGAERDRMDSPRAPTPPPDPTPEASVTAPVPPQPRARREATIAPLGAGSAALTAERTAASLFRDARVARRTGELESARALYSELQASFPDSSEARVSRVSLGKLLLLGGDAAAAERQFRAYLAHAGGDLVEEALVGRAEALARLGESGEERRVWQLLQARYPSSVYAERARKRLEELAER
jgi:hypothetical protein